MSVLNFEARAGAVDLTQTRVYRNEAFGYTLFEEVLDPENPDGPRAIAMHVPVGAMSKAWQLVEPGYSERVELLDGAATLFVNPADTSDWLRIILDDKNPTGDDLVIKCGDTFCVVADQLADAVLLSRPSKTFDISFETSLTSHPTDKLAEFMISMTALQ